MSSIFGGATILNLLSRKNKSRILITALGSLVGAGTGVVLANYLGKNETYSL